MSAESTELAPFTAEQYLKDRVEFKVEAYRKKGARYRWGYLIMASTSVVTAASVPVLINLESVPPIAPTLLSLLVTSLVGLEGLIHFREHWKNYDMMKSLLRQEANLFQARAGPYRGESVGAEPFALFVERIEEEIAKERAQTIQMRTTRTSEQEQHREPFKANPLAEPQVQAAESLVSPDVPHAARR